MPQSWIFFLRLFIFLKQLKVENVRLRKKINMDRRAFIHELKLPIMATCAICLGSCAKDDITTPGGGNTGGNNTGGNTTNSFKVDLTKELQAVGSFIFNDKIIVVRLATGSVPSSFVAILSPVIYLICRCLLEKRRKVYHLQPCCPLVTPFLYMVKATTREISPPH